MEGAINYQLRAVTLIQSKNGQNLLPSLSEQSKTKEIVFNAKHS